MAPYSPALALNARPQQPHLLCFARRLQRLSTPGDQRPPVTEPCAASLTLRLHMHGLIYETSIHVRQNQPGSRLCRSSSRHSRSFPHRSSCFLHHLPQRSALRVATLHPPGRLPTHRALRLQSAFPHHQRHNAPYNLCTASAMLVTASTSCDAKA